MHEQSVGETPARVANIALSIDCTGVSKSFAITDESLVKDLNIWLFDSSGSFAESHYMDGLSIHSSGSVSFDSSAGGHSLLVVIGTGAASMWKRTHGKATAWRRCSTNMSKPI